MLRFGLTRLARARLIAFGNSGSVSAAALSLNFLTGTLDARITFTRASTATFVGSNGLIQSATTNTPRFDYNPSTLAALGLLIEEQRTNIITQSGSIGSTPWAYLTCTGTLNNAVAPDGTTTATLITSSGGSNAQAYQGPLASTATATVYTASAFFKKGTAAFGWLDIAVSVDTRVWINLTTGALGTAQAGITATVQNFGNGWYRLTATMTSTVAGSAYVGTGLSDADNSTVTTAGTTAYVWGAQLEAGAFATSYIPTTTATVTRSQDVASMTGTNFSSWYNASTGTFVINAASPASGTRIIWQADDGTANNRITIWTNGTAVKADIVTGGVSQASLSLGAITANTAFKVALAYAAADFAGSLNGAAVVSVASGTVPTVTQGRIGADTIGNYLCEHTASLTYYNTRQSNAQLQALST